MKKWCTKCEWRGLARGVMWMVWALLSLVECLLAEEVALPKRPAQALGGRALAEAVRDGDREAREQRILQEFRQGNVPEFWRTFVPVTLRKTWDGKEHEIVLRVGPDYLAVGADGDYWLTPLSPGMAQAAADAAGCLLPTPRMVDAIYAAAALKLVPEPIPPSAAMTTVTVFWQHQELVDQQRRRALAAFPLGTLVAGHKKDVVLSTRLAGALGKVAIYGWHQTNGVPIQPLYLGHSERWVDYSHGVRLVARQAKVDGEPMDLAEVLTNPRWAPLVSEEGVLGMPRYGLSAEPEQGRIRSASPAWAGTARTNAFSEVGLEWRLDPGVRVVVWQATNVSSQLPVRLVLYATPNGNSIEQTLGWAASTNTDWRANIQHIAAQWRWLRSKATNVNWVLAVLECEGRSWPAWRRTHDPQDRRIPEIVRLVRERWAGRSGRLILTGHSGGGSFTFGYLNGVEAIPAEVERLAFLDSNYAYDSERGHARKISQWLNGGADRYLCVLAYHDSVALLDGKPFVSENGGTWGRSHAMQRDLAAAFPFDAKREGGFERYRALQGRAVFLLKENPDRLILHTLQVERNGFIHAMLTGTPGKERGYTYFGAPVYRTWIEQAPGTP